MTSTSTETELNAALREFGIEQPAFAPAPLRDVKGRFLKGTPGGPGRRPGQGLDLRSLAEREAEREGFDLNAAAWRVLKRLFTMAEAGDVAAAKELFTRIGMVDEAQQGGVQLVVVTGVDDAGQPAQGIALRVNAGAGERTS